MLNLNPDQQKAVKGMMQESVNSLIRQSGETELRKEIAERAAEEHEIPKKVFNRAVKLMYKDQLQTESETFSACKYLVEVASE